MILNVPVSFNLHVAVIAHVCMFVKKVTSNVSEEGNERGTFISG